MAKYTMLLAEYLQKGGQLPASFALIDGFEDLFVARYCDHEIGFETDALFSIKLEYVANLVMQAYADKIATRAFYCTKANNPVKAYYEKTKVKTNLGAQRSVTSIGAQENKTTDLPFDDTTAEPNSVSNLGEREDEINQDAVENNDLRETWKQDNGETIDELMRMLDFLNKDVTTLVQKCLDEFKPLFMGVY